MLLYITKEKAKKNFSPFYSHKNKKILKNRKYEEKFL